MIQEGHFILFPDHLYQSIASLHPRALPKDNKFLTDIGTPNDARVFMLTALLVLVNFKFPSLLVVKFSLLFPLFTEGALLSNGPHLLPFILPLMGL